MPDAGQTDTHPGQLVKASKELIEGHDQLLGRALGRQAGEALDICKQNTGRGAEKNTARTEKKRETRRKKGGRKKEKKTIKKKEKRVQESIISANVVWVIFGWLPSETVPIKAIWAALILSKVMHCRWVTLRPS